MCQARDNQFQTADRDWGRVACYHDATQGPPPCYSSGPHAVRSHSGVGLQADSKLWPFSIVNKDGKPVIEVEVDGKTKGFTPEEVLTASPSTSSATILFFSCEWSRMCTPLHHGMSISLAPGAPRSPPWCSPRCARSPRATSALRCLFCLDTSCCPLPTPSAVAGEQCRDYLSCLFQRPTACIHQGRRCHCIAEGSAPPAMSPAETCPLTVPWPGAPGD